MQKQADQSISNSTKDYRKSFAQQAGIPLDMIKDLQYQVPRRQTRHRRQPIMPGQDLKTHNTLHDTKQQHHRSPVTSMSRQQPTAPSTLTTPKRQTRAVTHTTPKALRTPQTKYSKKQIPSIPKSVDEFYQNYITFSTRLFKDQDNEANFIDKHKQELFQLLETTIQHGGIVKIISQGYKNDIFQQFVQRFKVQTSQDIFRIYKHYLLHFEYHLLENYTFKEYHNAVPLFEEAIFVDEQQLRNFLDKNPLDPKYFDNDIMLFRNGQEAIGIDSNKIHLDKVAEHYKNSSIDIRIQKAMDYGFKPRMMRNEPYQMEIGNYRTYQKLCEQYALNQASIDDNFIDRLGQVKNLDVNGTTFKERVNNEEIFFGVNFDPDDGLLFDYINEKVDGTFIGYKQEFDLLSYLDQQVPGCSFPQFYFKVKGVWTGGHQENINMCSVNINHGPDASEWYSMEFKYVEQFRAQLKKEHKMDLYGSQGLWYQKINWFMEQGKYPVKKIIQKKGDIVVSGPGTLHWVRSHGIALQSAWNQFPITYRMMNYAFCRQQENQRINFIRSNTIPLKILTLKLLNHQPPQLTTEIKKLCLEKLKIWLKKQEDIFDEFYEEDSQFPSEQPRYEKLEDLQGFCTKCRQEILIYFVNGKKVEDILCLNCYKKEFKNKKKNKRVYVRNNLFDLNLLIKKTESGKPFKQIKAFCGQYVGKVPFQCEQNNCKVDKQSVMIQKINAMNQQLNKCDSKRINEFMKKLKSKRVAHQQQEKDEKKPAIVQKQQQMDLQPEKKQQKADQKQIVSEKLNKSENFTIKNGVKYVGKSPPSKGWWNFQVPERLRIVTEQNHLDLLFLIHRQQQALIEEAKWLRLPKVTFPYFIQKSTHNNHNNRDNRDNREKNIGNNIRSFDDSKFCDDLKFSDDPKFSQDEEVQQYVIKKKVHKNQDHIKNESSKKEETKSNPMQLFPKPNESKQNSTAKVRKDSSESRKSKKSHKHKKQKSSRSKSHQKQRKNHKKNRSGSPKSSVKQSKKQEKRHSPSVSHRSKSRGKSSRRSSNRIDEQRSSRNKQMSRDRINDHRNDDRRNERSDFSKDFNRDNVRNYNESKIDRDSRNNRRNDNGSRYERRNNDNEDSSKRYEDRGQRRNLDNKGDHKYNERNNYNNNSNFSRNWNNKDGSNNNNSQQRDQRESGYHGGKYHSNREQQGSNNQSDRRYDSRYQTSRPYNNEGRYDNKRQDRSQQHENVQKQSDDRNASKDSKQKEFSKIVQEKNEDNDIDY